MTRSLTDEIEDLRKQQQVLSDQLEKVTCELSVKEDQKRNRDMVEDEIDAIALAKGMTREQLLLALDHINTKKTRTTTTTTTTTTTIT